MPKKVSDLPTVEPSAPLAPGHRLVSFPPEGPFAGRAPKADRSPAVPVLTTRQVVRLIADGKIAVSKREYARLLKAATTVEERAAISNGRNNGNIYIEDA